MTQYANIDRWDFFDRIETSDWYQIEKVGNNSAFDDNRKNTPDEWLKQDTAWLVNEIPNISFLDIWDTLLEDKKTLHWRRWAHLVVWKASKSIELMYINKFKLSFEPNYMSDVDNRVRRDIDTPYLDWLWEDPQYTSLYATYWPLSWIVKEDWRYRIIHKEEIRPQTGASKVVCYVNVYRKDNYWNYYNINYWWYAVSWWVANWTLYWTTSWTNPNWTCSVSFSLWNIFQRMPTWWMVEIDLMKDDIFVLRMRDQEPNATTWAPQWNELTLEPYSNFISVEYIDMASI